MSWQVMVEPVEGNTSGADEKNEGGVGVFLVNGNSKQEVSRVAYIRRHSRNPDTSFRYQLREEVDKARDALVVLNEQFSNRGMLV